MRIVGLAGSAPVIAVLVGLTAVLLISRRDWASFWALGGSLCMATILTWTIKMVVARQRPVGALVESWDSQWSFPSGHAALSLTFFGLAAYLAQMNVRTPSRRRTVVGACFTIVIVIGASRVADGAHDTIDVLGGYAVAAASLMAGVVTRRRLTRPSSVADIETTREG